MKITSLIPIFAMIILATCTNNEASLLRYLSPMDTKPHHYHLDVLEDLNAITLMISYSSFWKNPKEIQLLQFDPLDLPSTNYKKGSDFSLKIDQDRAIFQIRDTQENLKEEVSVLSSFAEQRSYIFVLSFDLVSKRMKILISNDENDCWVANETAFVSVFNPVSAGTIKLFESNFAPPVKIIKLSNGFAASIPERSSLIQDIPKNICNSRIKKNDEDNKILLNEKLNIDLPSSSKRILSTSSAKMKISFNIGCQFVMTISAATYTLTLATNASDTTKKDNVLILVDNLNVDPISELDIGNFEVYSYYNFTLAYTDSNNQNLEETLSFIPYYDMPVLVPNTVVEINREINHTIIYSLLDKFNLLSSNSNTWTTNSSVISVTFKNYDRFTITYMECSLNPNSQASAIFSFGYCSYKSIYKRETSVTFIAKSDTFYVNLKDKNRVQSSTRDLVLEVEAILPLKRCPNAATDFTYNFACSKKAVDGTVAPCSDSSAIFDKNQTASTLTVPKSYFAAGETLTITVTVSTSDTSIVDNGYFEILGDETTILKTTCSISNCRYFVNNTDMYFKVAPIDPSVKYEYNWTIVPALASSEYLAVTSNLLIRAQTGLTGYVKVIAEIINSPTKGKQELILPVNSVPHSGNMTLNDYRPYWNEDIKVRFVDWIDEDLPLRYQVLGPDNVPLTHLGYDTEYKFPVYGNKTEEYAILSALVYDNLGSPARKDQNISMRRTSAIDTLQYYPSFTTQIQADLNGLPLISKILRFYSILNFLRYEELNFLFFRSVNPDCPCNKTQYNYECTFGSCYCTAGTFQFNCGLQNSSYSTINSSKVNMIYMLKSLYDDYLDSYFGIEFANPNDDPSNQITSAVISSINCFTEASYFSTTAVTNVATEILQKMVANLTVGGLTEEQARVYAKFVGRSLSTMQKEDCDCRTYECQSLENKTMNSIYQISSGLLYQKLASEPPTNISYDEYDIVVLKNNICQLDGLSVFLSDNAPLVVFEQNSTDGLDCSVIADITILAMSTTFYKCSNNTFKDRVMIDIKDTETSKPLTFPDLKVNLFTDDKRFTCYKNCLEKGTYCQCDISVFNFKDNFDLIFKNSGIKYLGSVEAFLNWDWQESPVFWANAIVFVWFVGHLISLAVVPKLMSFCLMDKIEASSKISVGSAIATIYLMKHGVISLYALSQDPLPKVVRTCIYYLKLAIYSAFCALFGNGSKGMIEKIKNNETYVIFIPYLIVLPLNIIITTLLKKLYLKKASTKRKEKIFKGIGLSIVFIAALGCLYIMFIISANMGDEINSIWLQLFLTSVIQEITIAPAIALFVEKIAYKLYMSNAIPSQKKRFEKMVDPKSMKIYELMYKSLPVKIKAAKVKPINTTNDDMLRPKESETNKLRKEEESERNISPEKSQRLQIDES